MGTECTHGWNAKNWAKFKQYYYFHAEFLEEYNNYYYIVNPSPCSEVVFIKIYGEAGFHRDILMVKAR